MYRIYFFVLLVVFGFVVACAPQKEVSVVESMNVTENYSYRLQIAISYVVSGYYQRAISEFEDLKKIKETPELYNYLGLAYMGVGDFDRAVEAYKKAIGLKSGYPEAYSNLSACYVAMGNFDAAIEAASKALEDKSYPKPEIPLTNMAQAYFGKGEIDLAIDTLNKALMLNPFYPVPYEILIRYYLEAGDYQSAKRYLNDADALEINSAGLSFYRALFKLRDGERDEAKKLFNEIVRTYPGTIWANQAKVYLEVVE
ncbi:MAG: tetratricopeptide repeat protein [candidate division WOR-3 bacterium]